MKAFKILKLLIILVAVSTTIHANNINTRQPGDDDATVVVKEFVKNYNKTFNINAKQLVILSNKYGKIDVKTGTGNQVVVNVTVKVNTDSQKDADETFDRINIAFTEGPDFVKTETDIESQNSSWIKWSWGNNRGNEYTIEYDVTMPAANNLDIANKYGNSYIAALNNWVKIDQKYGDFKLESAGSATVNLAYGRGSVGAVNGLTATVSYSKMSAPNLKDVSIKSKYSEFKFDKTANLAIQSAYDDYEIGDVENLSIDSKYGDFSIGAIQNLAVVSAYTDYKIKQLDNSADFKTSYGDVKIQTVKNNFGTINIDGGYTDFILGIAPSTSYQLDVKTKYGDVNRPASLSTRLDSEKGSATELVGHVGNASAKSLIKARLNYGDLVLK